MIPNTLIEFYIDLKKKKDIELLFFLQQYYILKPFGKCSQCNGGSPRLILSEDPTDHVGGTVRCELCNSQLFVVRCNRSHRSKMRLRARSDVKFSLCYECPKCRTVKSCLAGSYFENSHLALRDILLLMFCWCANVSVKTTTDMMRVNKMTVVQWFQYCRDITSTKLISMNNFKIGGPGHVVMIDESMLSKRKYNRGRLTQQLWIFGMVDDTTGVYVVQFVQNRTRQTLLPIIRRYCENETEIWSDEWKAYNRISEMPDKNFIHRTVNHSVNYVDPVTGVCTNRIEGMWSCVRRFYRQKRTSTAINPDNISSYLDEFLWRQFWDVPHKSGETLNFLLTHLGEWSGLD